MSDPVTNLAIEDVLSSIRRLVTEGDTSRRSEVFAQPAAAADAATRQYARQNADQPTDNAGKLVLTPAFRITEQPRPVLYPEVAPYVADATENPTISFLRSSPQTPESRSALEQRIADLEAAVTDQADDWEPDGSEDVPVVDWSSPQVGESLIFASRAMPQSDRSGVLDLGQIGTRIHPVILDDVAKPEALRPAAPYDLSEDLDLSATQAQYQEHEFGPADAADLSDDPDQTDTADQDALRKLVVDIVRQELQGPMGERITRNVRKMVRREIYRILSSQEFES